MSLASIEPLVRCEGAGRTYGAGPAALVALNAVSCEVGPGARVALVGESGSGKSTLIHLMAGLDEPTAGLITWPAIGSLEALRPGPVAVVFQGPSLMPPLSVVENVALPLTLAGCSPGESRGRAEAALARLGLEGLGEKLPEEISGGQAQRVAVARALAGEPQLILADEPTGQLDHEIGAMVIDELLEVANHCGAGMVIATHDDVVADRLAVRWRMRDGMLAVGGHAPAAGEPVS